MRIGIIGPESTGKSTLSRALANHFNAQYVPEFARAYIEGLSRPYSYKDVVSIAQHQIQELRTFSSGLVFFDTELIITKVWFLYKYGKCPQWLEECLTTIPMDYYLLCYPDLQWQPDSCRENGDKREELFQRYLDELISLQVPYAIIRGQGSARLQSAIAALHPLLS